MSQAERKAVRAALSDAFVDNEVDYPDIARRVSRYERRAVEGIFFSEVAPICYANLNSPVPSVWTGFNHSWLNSEIEHMLKKREASFWRRQRDNLLIGYLRLKHADTWRSIKENLPHSE